MPLLLLTVACVALCACSEPSYRAHLQDAGDAATAPRRDPEVAEAGPLDAASDAGLMMALEEDVGPRSTEVPAWAESLRGPYASRTFVFKQDDLTVTRGSQIRLHRFEMMEGRLVLRSKLCEYVADTALAELELVDPSAAPEQIEDVLFSNVEERWSTDGPPYQVGFTRELPTICAGKVGEHVAKPASHVWTAGPRCRCAEVAEEPLADDCRVLDPDGDRQPGLTFHLMGTLLGAADVFVGYESSSHFSNGSLRADGTLRANVRAADTNYQFGCVPEGCTNLAVIGRWCPSSFNSADFVPLPDGEASCASVLAARDRLFPMAAPAVPPRCFQ